MKKITLITAAIIVATNLAFGQGTAINKTGATADNSAILDLSDTTKGILIPRMKKANKLAISNPATGLMIYQTDDTTGFWYFNSVKWVQATGPAGATGATGPSAQSTYKRMFATSTWGTGKLSTWAGSGGVGGIAGGDNICQSRAVAAGLSGTWLAFLSTSTVDACSRFMSITVPLVNMKNHLLYYNGDEIYCRLGSNCNGSMGMIRYINYDEFGNYIALNDNDNVWTGTLYTGLKCSDNCIDWTSEKSSDYGCFGRALTSNTWKYTNTSNPCNSNTKRLICIEQ